MKIVLPKLTSYQEKVWKFFGNSPQGKIAIIKSVRQSGKSFFAQMMLIKTSLESTNRTSAIFEPSLSQARQMFNAIKKYFGESGLIRTANASLLEIEFINGSRILFKSTEQENRGYTINGILILDEAAYLADEDIFTILPVANATNAPILVISTPFVRDGYFYNMFIKGINCCNRKIKSFDWSKDPEISRFLDDERKAYYKEVMSRAKYTTEIEGEFLDDRGLFFVGYDKCIIENPIKEGVISIGIDFGGGGDNDDTVITAINEWGQMLWIERTNNLSPMQQVEWLASIINKCNNPIKNVFAEKNGLGVAYVDALKKAITKKNVRVTDWITSNSSKNDIINNLAIAFENEKIGILNNKQLLIQLGKFEQIINPTTKTIRYGGKNCKDDMVMSLAIAYEAYMKNNRVKYDIR